jgi:1-aminocyclopropane-1-carboxylate deaminase
MLEHKINLQVATEILRVDNQHNISISILRLDKINSLISGNKYFKLKYYLADAIKKNKSHLATFGGAFSNHIIATALAANLANLKSTGFISSYDTKLNSPTLEQAKALGMEIILIDKSEKRNKADIIRKYDQPESYWIHEGGYGEPGVRGSMEILDFVKDLASFTHIICAVGTGTTIAGLIKKASSNQSLIGISSMKGNNSIQEEICFLLNTSKAPDNLTIYHNYHFGGYARYSEELIKFMNHCWKQYKIPTDFVYTGKALFGTFDLIDNGLIPPSSKVLFIHTGGLQGNISLPENLLDFV